MECQPTDYDDSNKKIVDSITLRVYISPALKQGGARKNDYQKIYGGKRVMSLILRRDPFNELRSPQEDFNRTFGTAFPRLFGEEGLTSGKWMPSVDIREGENEIVLEADLPGLKPGDFELSVENRVLALKGERKFEKQSDTDNYHRVERSYGSFTRTFTLPSTVNVDAVSADFRDGVLRVVLPKKEEVKARQIQVKVTGEGEAPKVEAAAQ